MTDAQTPQTSVAKRRVFYIPGYDPIHPRRYRELYRKEGAAQAEISGYEINISPKENAEVYGWHACGVIDGRIVNADIDVLVWSDIVRSSMSNSIPATYWQLVRTAWIYVSTGALRRLMWMRKGPVLAALYPVGMLILQLVLAIAAGAVTAAAVLGALSSGLGWFGLGLGDYVSLVRWGVILGVAPFVMRWFKAKDRKFFAYYLMHDYAYAARWYGANPSALEERLKKFEEQIVSALGDDIDEVLVVGHSSGAHLAVSILADLIKAGRLPKVGPKLAFLSLGQVVPMMSFLPAAHKLRADLAYLSVQDRITWVDVTAPGDGCAFALCDPVAVSGVAPNGKIWPLVISAAFTKTLKPETWKKLRWRFFRLHFQYLCAFDAPGDYDYFQITAGPMTLGDRYRGRQPSNSRIDVPASKYTSVRA